MGNTGSASELGVATHGQTLVDCVWEIKHGTKDKTKPVTLWRCTKAGKSECHVAQARRAMHALKTTRHPLLLSLIEGIETDAAIVMVTERATPLHLWVSGDEASSEPSAAAASGGGSTAGTPEAWADEGYRLWGIRCVLLALEFLHEKSKLIHGALGPRSVLVTEDGSWKLGGFELSGRVAAPTDPLPDAMATSTIGTHPLRVDGGGGVFASPEQAGGNRAPLQGLPPWAVDAWGMAALLVATAGSGPRAARAGNARLILPASVTGRPQLLQAATAAGLSPPLQALVRKLASGQARARPRPSRAIAALKTVFARHPIVGVLSFLRDLPLKSPEEKRTFFAALPGELASLPATVRTQMVLPALMLALEFGAAGGGGTVVLAPLLEIGRELPDEEYKSRVVPCVVRLYGSPDRATRMQLLTHLGAYVSHLDSATVNSAVWPRALEGLADSSPPLRQATLKAVEGFCPHLTSDNLCGSLVKALRRVQSVDQEPALRVNASICMGRTAQFLPASKRVPVLLPPLLAALQDGFAPARAAALKAIAHVLQVVAKASAQAKEAEEAEAVGKACAEAVARHVTPTAASRCLDADDKVRAAATTLLRRCCALLEARASALDRAQARARAEAEVDTDRRAGSPAPAPAPTPAPAPAPAPRRATAPATPAAAPVPVASGWGDDAFDDDDEGNADGFGGSGSWGSSSPSAAKPTTAGQAPATSQATAARPAVVTGNAAADRSGADAAAERRRQAEARRAAARQRLEARRRSRQQAAAASAAAPAPALAATRVAGSPSTPAGAVAASLGTAVKSDTAGWGDDDEDWDDF